MHRYFISLFVPFLLSILTACAAPPESLDLAMTHTTAEKNFIVTLQAPATPAAINQIHSWQLRLTSPTGVALSNVRIAVDGGMPQHGHGLPTRPQVTPPLADGSYRIDGMKFSMTGWWEIKLTIQSDAGIDKVTFNTVIQ